MLVDTLLGDIMLVGNPGTQTRLCICYTGFVLNREVFINTFDFTRAIFSEQKNLKIAVFETVLVEVMLVGNHST